MKRFVKALAIALGVLVVAVLGAGVWFALGFDPNAYRGRIAALVEEATGRALAIDGDLGVTLFPRLAIEVGAVRLAQPEGFGETPFTRVEHAAADVRLLPLLLHGRIEVGSLHFEGLSVELRRRADGTTNWSDLAPNILEALRRARAANPEAASGAEDARGGGLSIGPGEIDGASVRYIDAQAQREISLTDGSVRTSGFTLGEPFDVETAFRLDSGALSAQVRGRGEAVAAVGPGFELRDGSLDFDMEDAPVTGGALRVGIDAPAATYIAGELRIDRPRVEIKSAGGSHIQVEGSLAAATLALSGGDALAVAAPALDLALEGEPVPGGRARLKAQSPAVEASIEEQTLRMNDVAAEAYGLTVHASATGTRLLDAPAIAGRVTLAPFSPRAFMESIGRAAGATTDPQALTRAELDAQYGADAGGLRLHDMHLKLDDTTITGELTLTDFLAGAVRFDLAADRLVFDRYVVPSEDATVGSDGGFVLTSEELRALDLSGSLRVADLQLAGLRSTDVVIRVGGAGDVPRAGNPAPADFAARASAAGE